MGEHQLRRPMDRELQLIGATTRCGDRYAWFHGQNHDYFLDLTGGRVIAEVCIRPSQFQDRGDMLFAVTWVADFKPGDPPPPREFYVARSAARNRIEEKYGAVSVLAS